MLRIIQVCFLVQQQLVVLSKITVNYIAAASTLVDKMIATKSSNSNVVKGNIIS